MAQADGINILTLQFANPDIPDGDPNSYKVDSTFAFSFPIPGQSTRTLVGPKHQSSQLEGLLYVPTLPADDPCNKTAAGLLPRNVTTEQNLPAHIDLSYIGLIPWINSSCSVSYFNAAQRISNTVAVITYIANDVSKGFTSATPPGPNDPVWKMNNSLAWKDTWDAFAVYSLNADSANVTLKPLSQYSGNMSSAPYADNLKNEYDQRNYVRLYASIDAGFDSTLPSLWVFLLIVLGVLLSMIGLTSLCMHMVQRQRRRHIRNRVVAGELDLESLGIKRLRVPKELLDKVPLVVYVAPEDELTPSKKSTASPSRGASPNSSGETNEDQIASSHQRGERSPASSIEIAKGTNTTDVVEQENLPPISSLPHQHLDFAQPACSICLDDFMSHQTIVRVLPCKHVFHPACIDPVLREYSSLCPMCKASVLPQGYCPEITNSMVRRIRGLQRLREIQAQRRGQPPPPAIIHGRAATFRQIGERLHWGNRTNRDVELGRVGQPDAPGGTAAPASTSRAVPTTTALSQTITMDASQARPANMSREEWARHRAENMLNGPASAEEEEEANRQQAAARPRWRRALAPIFPSFA